MNCLLTILFLLSRLNITWATCVIKNNVKTSGIRFPPMEFLALRTSNGGRKRFNCLKSKPKEHKKRRRWWQNSTNLMGFCRLIYYYADKVLVLKNWQHKKVKGPMIQRNAVADTGGEACPPPPFYFWTKSTKTVKEQKQNCLRAGPHITSRSGSATETVIKI